MPFDAVSVAERVFVFCDDMTCGSANTQRRAVSGRTSTPSGLIEFRVRHIGLRQIAGTSPFFCTRQNELSDSLEGISLDNIQL